MDEINKDDFLRGPAEEDKFSFAKGEDKNAEDKKFDPKLNEMIKAGLYLGHKTSRIHPKMMPYIAGSRNGVHIIDLEKTSAMLDEAINFMKSIASESKILLIVGTKIQVKKLAREFAEELKIPFVVERWLGGTFTNFKTIQKRIDYFKDLEKKKETGELNKYTKKERAKMDKELRDLETNFGGIKNMERIPDAVFVLDARKDDLAIREAKRKNVKVVAIVDTNIDPSAIDYPIPANDDAISSVKYILDRVKEAILKTKS